MFFQLIKTQNKLILRQKRQIVNLLYLLFGCLMLVFAEFFLVRYQLFIFPILILLMGVFLIQSVYKFKYSTIDISNLIVYPLSQNRLIIKFLMIDITEYKSILLVLYIISVSFFCPQIIGVLIILILIFSITTAFLDFLAKRYFIYRIISGLFAGLSYFVLYLFSTILFPSPNNNHLALLNKLESNIIEHNIVSFLIIMICFFSLLATYTFFIKKILRQKLFADETVVSRNGSLY